MAQMPDDRRKHPELTIIVPAYNEESIIAYTVRRLAKAFANDGVVVDVLVVDNGSQDRTGEVVASVGREFPTVRCIRVDKNRGWGHGVREGLRHTSSAWVCTIPADSQVDAEDVVRLYDVAQLEDTERVAKVVRRFRMDGPIRRVVTFAYNSFVHLLWPRLLSWDVNAVPKLLPLSLARRLDLQSDGWALDAEIMVKSHLLGVPVFEFNVLSRRRGSGKSHVRLATCLELFTSLVRLRFSRELREFVRRARRESTPGQLVAAGHRGLRGPNRPLAGGKSG